MYQFEELTEETRCVMLKEFLAEENGGNPYRSKILSREGLLAYPEIMHKALLQGSEETLAVELSRPEYWLPYTTYQRSGKLFKRSVNFEDAARRLAITEFNTWYVCGLASRLLNEGVEECEVYRAEIAQEPRDECLTHEGARYLVQAIYEGHRARYWPPPGNKSALSIPAGPNCHHTIRRVRIL